MTEGKDRDDSPISRPADKRDPLEATVREHSRALHKHGLMG